MLFNLLCFMNGLSHYNIGMFSKPLKMSSKRLTTGKNEKVIYLTCPRQKIYREEAVGLKRSN